MYHIEIDPWLLILLYHIFLLDYTISYDLMYTVCLYHINKYIYIYTKARSEVSPSCQWQALNTALEGFSAAERPRVEKRLPQLLADPFALQLIVDELLKSAFACRDLSDEAGHI